MCFPRTWWARNQRWDLLSDCDGQLFVLRFVVQVSTPSSGFPWWKHEGLCIGIHTAPYRFHLLLICHTPHWLDQPVPGKAKTAGQAWMHALMYVLKQYGYTLHLLLSWYFGKNIQQHHPMRKNLFWFRVGRNTVCLADKTRMHAWVNECQASHGQDSQDAAGLPMTHDALTSRNPLPQVRLHLENIPQSPQTVRIARDKVVKRLIIWGIFYVQTITHLPRKPVF